MKKLFALLLAVLMVASLAACGAKQETPAEGSSYADEDTQNPAMNFIGSYGAGRCTIEVQTDGMENTKVLVHWGSSAAEAAQWVMTGKLDGETLKLDYSDCVKSIVVFNESGELDSETVEYENGTGTFTFQVAEDGTTTLLWDDQMEHMADDLVFEYVGIIAE